MAAASEISQANAADLNSVGADKATKAQFDSTLSSASATNATANDTVETSRKASLAAKEAELAEKLLASEASALGSGTKTEKTVAEQHNSKAPFVLNINNNDTSAKKSTELLAKLSPESELATLENVSKRVESVIPDFKADGKATEFIAALQSGVKEMKEQLKAGREPGIDLKSLVSEALISAEVKVPKTAEVSLDKQLSQMTNILSAASVLNQNANQQNYLNTGLTETQGIKEVAQLQAESSKLVQQTVVNEKAVNIFKPEGQQQLTEKVRWMVNSKNLSAEIRLDPPDLGGMNIKVNLSGDSASVSFVVQSQHARDALDQAIPRLREMLDEQGIDLGESSVEQDGRGKGQSGDNQEHIASNADSNSGSGAHSGAREEASLDDNRNSDNADNLAQQSQGLTEEQLQGGVVQRISGSQIGGIDYYA
jgi:flagellar hook-length control protein FliK